MQRLRDNPELKMVADQNWLAMSEEPRSIWPSCWDIIHAELKVNPPGLSTTAIERSLNAHYKKLIAELQTRTRSYVWIIPGDLHKMVNSYLCGEIQKGNESMKVYESKLLGLHHTLTSPDYLLVKNNGSWILREAAYYNNSVRYRAAPRGPHNITNYGNQVRFEFSYNPYEYGQHNDCTGCRISHGAYIIHVDLANIPQSMAVILAAEQAAALQHAGLA